MKTTKKKCGYVKCGVIATHVRVDTIFCFYLCANHISTLSRGTIYELTTPGVPKYVVVQSSPSVRR